MLTFKLILNNTLILVKDCMFALFIWPSFCDTMFMKVRDVMTLIQIFLLFFKIGLFTFGGGYAMIPIIKREVVEGLHIIDEKTMTDYIAVAQAAPGMIALNVANLVGRHLRGMKGALTAVFGVMIPSFLIIVLIAGLLPGLLEYELFESILYGVLLSVIVLLGYAVFDLAKTIYRVKLLLVYAVLIALVVFLLNVHIVWVILSAFLFGTLHVFIKARRMHHD